MRISVRSKVLSPIQSSLAGISLCGRFLGNRKQSRRERIGESPSKYRSGISIATWIPRPFRGLRERKSKFFSEIAHIRSTISKIEFVCPGQEAKIPLGIHFSGRTAHSSNSPTEARSEERVIFPAERLNFKYPFYI